MWPRLEVRCEPQRWALLLYAGALIALSCQPETTTSIPATSMPSPLPSTTTPRTISADDALQAVLSSPDVRGSAIFNPFPRSAGSSPCQIRGGGPPPGIGPIAGACLTEVEANGSMYVVNFTETWDAGQFHHQDDPAVGELQHTWSFTVDGAGNIIDQEQYGHFAPQFVQ